MQSSTLQAILPTAASYYGKQIDANRQFLVGKINDVRSAWWKQKAMRRVLFRAEGCACVERCVENCSNGCRGPSRYLGMTLPVNLVTLDHVDWNGSRFPLIAAPINRSGFRNNCPVRCRGVEMLTGRACTEREIPVNNRGPIIVRPVNPKDNGKLAGIEYVTEGGRIIREDIKLDTVGYETKQRPLKILNLTFSPGRCGFVQVLTADGFEMGSYHPSVAAPKHIRVRVDGLCGCSHTSLLKWEGIAEPLAVMFDTDRVEVANLVDWENAFMALDLHFKANKSSSEMATLNSALQFAAASGEAELDAQQVTPAARLKPRGIAHTLRQINWLERRYYRVR